MIPTLIIDEICERGIEKASSECKKECREKLFEVHEV